MTRPSIPRAHNFLLVVYGYRTNACQLYMCLSSCVCRHGMHVSRSFTRCRAWDRNNYVTIINGDHEADAVPRHRKKKMFILTGKVEGLAFLQEGKTIL